MNFSQKVKDWYEGETKVYPNDPNNDFVLTGIYQKYHWTAKVARRLVWVFRTAPFGKVYYIAATTAMIYATFKWLLH